MEGSHSLSTPSFSGQLYCQGTETRLHEEGLNEDASVTLNNCIVLGTTEEEEYIQFLLNREIDSGFQRHDYSGTVIDDWIKSARLDAIAWILKTRASFGFRFQTAYLSLTYFDRFLSRKAIDREKYWAIRLLSVACLSLAVKMEECRVPSLTEFQVEGYKFGSRMIQRMELLVLNILEWRMSSITPFAYIHYLLRKFLKDESPPITIVSRTIEHILAVMGDVNLTDYRPSALAGAATLLASGQKLTRQSFTPNGFFEIENVLSCYNRMQELEMEKLTVLPKRKVSPQLSPIRLREINDFENSSSTSALSTKRKRLTFPDCDQTYHIPAEKQQQ